MGNVKAHRDGSVPLDGEIIGAVHGESRAWGFTLSDYREPASTPEQGWHSKREAAEMCARAHLETPLRGVAESEDL